MDDVSMDPVPTGGGVQTQQAIPGNPYGCYTDVDLPHRSTNDPGPGYINAYGHIYGCSGIPASAPRRIEMWLYRSSYSGWREVRHLLYKCPEGYNSPDCYLGGNMRAVISWKCPSDLTGFYNYKVEAIAWFTVGGTTYTSVRYGKQTGNWNDPGNVKCFL
jgi:hypothetical protein